MKAMTRASRAARALGVVAVLALGGCERGSAPGEGSEAAAPAPTSATAPALAASAADAFLVLPGDYAQGTTVAELEARFGKANVRQRGSRIALLAFGAVVPAAEKIAAEHGYDLVDHSLVLYVRKKQQDG